ncbi:serine/threonine-protein kinase [Nocardia sp. NPDC003963]
MLGAGTTFAGYRIERVLGRGGMGVVYLARHPRLPRAVALKLLNQEVSTDTELVRRFEREADVVARLEHPGIVGVLDRGTNDGHLWIAMQYIRGTDAASWNAAAQPPATVARLLGETALALDYAHSLGILHRDVKPANIVIADGDRFRNPHAVLTDFGIAGLIDSANTKITVTGTFTATLAYASPEQLSGEVVDHRSDQYSLACTLFALLAGQPPYAATNPGQVVTGHLSKPVPRITALRPDLPVALDTVLERAMAKQREDRFPSCAGFITAALDTFGHQQVSDAVDFARTAPTVHNSAPVGLQQGTDGRARTSAPDPIAAAQPVVAPGPGNSLRRGASPEPTDLGRAPGVILGVLVLVVIVGTAGLLLFDPNKTTRWGEQQPIANAFPGLVPERSQLPGWQQASCRQGDDPPGHEIYCRPREDSGVTFRIVDHSTPRAAQEELKSNWGFGPGTETILSPETQPAPNPTLAAPALMTVPPLSSRAAAWGDAYFSFPSDPVRDRFLISVDWPGHSVDDILREWWSKAPLEH